jgi:hypothetical protein
MLAHHEKDAFLNEPCCRASRRHGPLSRVIGLVYGATEWHPEPQWLLQAFDLEKNAVLSTSERKCIGAPEQERVNDERQEVPRGCGSIQAVSTLD